MEEQSRANSNKKMSKKKKIILSSGAAVILLGFGISALTPNGEAKTEKTLDTKVVLQDVVAGKDYEVTTNTTADGKEYAIVIGDDLVAEDVSDITYTYGEQVKEDVSVYVYPDAETTRSLPKEGYAEDLSFVGTTNRADDAGAVSVMEYISAPNIEADATAIAEWEIDENRSKTTKDGVLEIPLTLAEGSTTTEIIAQVKGLVNITDGYNETPTYNTMTFDISIGEDDYEYSTEHENVLAAERAFTYSDKKE